jgi:hypothetical protein
MSNARVDRMLRELSCDPSHPFFSAFFRLIGLATTPAKSRLQPVSVPASVLANAAAR